MKRICYYFVRGGITAIKLTYGLTGLDSIASVKLNFLNGPFPAAFSLFSSFRYSCVDESTELWRHLTFESCFLLNTKH